MPGSVGFLLENFMQTPLDPLVAELVERLSPAHREEFEERAAVMEFDGGKPRAHAEALALLNIIKNRPDAIR